MTTESPTTCGADVAGAAPCSAIPASAIKSMCEAWTEMNAIRARDGVPYEYWDDIMQRLDDEVKKATGRGCWLHPALYSPNAELSDSRPNVKVSDPDL